MMNILVTVVLMCGLLFFAGGTIGIIRFPDFYTRLHPAGKLDTAGLMLTMSAMALFVFRDLTLDSVLTSLKIILIIVFVMLTSPTATHAIIDAGIRAGLRPWTKKESEDGA